MNEIILRTHKGAYNTGEDIFGVVYLSINNPTAGRGVRLKFEGVEQFSYTCNDGQENGQRLEDKKLYIDSTDVTLYTCQDSDVMNLGTYCFPFKVPLLSEIPGSFYTNGDGENGKWLAQVNYWLKAELIDAESVSTVQSVVVNHPLPNSLLPGDPPMAVDCKIEVPHFLFLKKSLHVTAKLTKQVWQSGDVAKLRIIITNRTGINVSRICIKLCRELLLMKRGAVLACTDPNVWLDEKNDRTYIRPEGADPVVVWENIIADCSQEVLNKGLQEIWIPLKHYDNSPVATSLNGQHIQCYYYVDISVKLHNGQDANLLVPIYCLIHPKNLEWHAWKPPEWVYDTTVITGNSIFSVPETTLRSSDFSEIPRFQALSICD